MWRVLRNRAKCIAWGAVAAGITSGGAGCFSYTAADAKRRLNIAITPAAADIWPARDEAAVAPFQRATTAELHRYELDPDVPPESIPEESRQLAAQPWRRILYNEIRAGGLLRVFEDPHAADDDLGRAMLTAFVGFEPNATYLSSYRVQTVQFRAELDKAQRGIGPALVKPPVGLRYRRGDAPMLDEGIELGLPMAVPEAPRGILLHLTALVGNQYETQLISTMQERGWVVVHLSTLTRVVRPNEAQILEASRRREARQQELWESSDAGRAALAAAGQTSKIDWAAQLAAMRQAQAQAAAEIPRPPTGFEPASYRDEDLRAAADRIASAVDETVAENAYAAQAALAYVDKRFPQLADKPVVVLGFSAGALLSPPNQPPPRQPPCPEWGQSKVL